MKKKKIKFKFNILIIAAVALIGCQKSESAPAELAVPEPAALVQEIAEQISFECTMSEMEAGLLTYLYEDIDVEGLSDYCVWLSESSTADEIAVFVATDEESARKVTAAVQNRIEVQKASFEGYLPEELVKLENSLMVQKGCYVVLCVASDTEQTQKILGNYGFNY